MNRRLAPVVIACSLVSAAALAGERWTPERLLDLRRPASVALSPDGRSVAFAVTSVVGTDDHRYSSQVWVAPAGKPAFALTSGETECGAPAWSPDGRKIVFVSARETGKPNLWLIDPAGGEAVRLTDAAGGVGTFRWSPDGRQIAFAMTDPEPETKTKAVFRVADSGFRYRHVYRIRVADFLGQPLPATRVTSGDFDVDTFDWSPDGTRLVVSHQPTPRIYEWRNTDVSIVPAAGGDLIPLVRAAGMDMGALWSPDGKTIAFVSNRGEETWARDWKICLVPADGGEVRVLAPTPDAMPGENLEAGLVGWAADGSGVWFTEPAGTVTELFFAPADGSPCRKVDTREGVKAAFSVAPKSKTVAYAGESCRETPEVYVQPLGAAARRVSDLNAGLARMELGRSEVVRWKSFDGREIEGLLFVPADAAAGTKLPLLVEVHGGPTSMFQQTYAGLESVWTAAGYALLRVNFRSSDGYGRAFRLCNLGDWGGAEVKDVLAGVDHVVGLGIADPARLGLFGWSYGGFLTAITLGRTDRFKAAVEGAGMTDLASFQGTTDIDGFIPSFMRSEVWRDETEALWRDRSAVFHAEKITTPLLILHGEADPRVPVSQGYELYRALKRAGKTVALVTYPGMGHGYDDPDQDLDINRRHLDWFGKYLGGR